MGADENLIGLEVIDDFKTHLVQRRSIVGYTSCSYCIYYRWQKFGVRVFLKNEENSAEHVTKNIVGAISSHSAAIIGFNNNS